MWVGVCHRVREDLKKGSVFMLNCDMSGMCIP